ncbi:MAG: CsgG/HfaB family protein [Candidatus Methylopumilus sp.]|jgi:curli biogenesis system outer membrane secretion channel CsgG
MSVLPFKFNRRVLICLPAVIGALSLNACIENPVKMGSNNPTPNTTSSSSAGESSSGENTQLEKCSESMGTVSLVENQSAGWYGTLTGQYKLPPTASLLKLYIQQSNCFVVVERSAAGLRAMSRERELEQVGELRKGSKFGKGQVVSSDYAITPEVVFSDNDTGGMGASLGGLIGGNAGRVLGSVGGNTKTREASALLSLVDNRSSVQIAASEGSASKTDWGGFGSVFGGRGGAGLSGYSNTPQGKVVAAAFMDAYNQMVRSLRNYKAQEVKGGLGKGGRLKVGQ